jgi:hypothetical protein
VCIEWSGIEENAIGFSKNMNENGEDSVDKTFSTLTFTRPCSTAHKKNLPSPLLAVVVDIFWPK